MLRSLSSAVPEELKVAVWDPPGLNPPTTSSGTNDQVIGLGLAISSSVFIGASFVIKKRGLRQAGSTGLRAGKFSTLPSVYSLENIAWRLHGSCLSHILMHAPQNIH